MTIIPILADEKKCTGCFSCINICPNNALTMKENHEGFIMPFLDEEKCIGCKKCEHSCPALHVVYKNDKHPDCYAVRADDELRKVSSSGGLFSLLASYILSQNGIVCGAAFNEKFEVHHVIIHKQENLRLLRGSKYVQSHIDYIYKEIKAQLEKGILVLFSGTPCQVAGLYAYLGSDHKNLFTADIMCHGVPSQTMFLKHINGLFPHKSIQSINFRDKKFGWTSLKLSILYTDGSEYIGEQRNDAYERSFHPNLALRRSCADCPFSVFPRQGDITMGDFWGYEIFSPQYADAKGTSLAFINNSKGAKIFNAIRNSISFEEKIIYQPEQIKNRVYAKYPAHPGRARFFDLIKKGRDFDTASKMALESRYDVGIVGIPTVPNFGGALTYFGLYHTVEDLGFSALMIERPENARAKVREYESIYTSTPYPSYSIAPIFPTKESMRKLNHQANTFLVGSDQLFNDFLYNEMGRWITLDWVNDNKNKVAYAASFGHDFIWSPEETRAEMSFFMKKFDAFSVREDSAVRLCNDEFGVKATQVLDPVFLCNPEHYLTLAKEGKRSNNNHYIGAYILDPDQHKEEIIHYIENKLKLPVEVFSEFTISGKQKNFNYEICVGNINDRMNNLVHSEFFITDSFHGVCFCIIHHKDFIVIPNKKRGLARFNSILGKFGLLDRIVENISDLYTNKKIFNSIDYKKIDKKLAIERNRCLNWLDSSIRNIRKKSYSDYDIMIKKIDSINTIIDKLSLSNKELKTRNSDLLRYFGIYFPSITSIYDYFKELERTNMSIFISIKDTPGFKFNDHLVAYMKKIGSSINLSNNHWHTYVGIFENRKCVYEKLSKYYEETSFATEINKQQISIRSGSWKGTNIASIKINNREYAVNSRGINIVVYDKSKDFVIDSVCFDTHENLSCLRR